jgi:hypothetical protein
MAINRKAKKIEAQTTSAIKTQIQLYRDCTRRSSLEPARRAIIQSG